MSRFDGPTWTLTGTSTTSSSCACSKTPVSWVSKRGSARIAGHTLEHCPLVGPQSARARPGEVVGHQRRLGPGIQGGADLSRIAHLIGKVEAGPRDLGRPHVHPDRRVAEIQRGEVLDLVTGDHHALVEQRAIRAEPRFE